MDRAKSWPRPLERRQCARRGGTATALDKDMPEGHTLHRLSLDHSAAFKGRVVRASSPQGRFSEEATLLDGHRVEAVTALGKHLFYRFEEGPQLHVHLGLFGKFRTQRQPAAEPRGAVRLRLETTDICIDLAGPTACELMAHEELEALRARIGPDLLDAKANPEVAWERIHASKRSIGALLLDQSILSGVGNVYRAEALFVVGIHPETRGCELDRRTFRTLWKTMAKMLADGVRDRRIITVPFKGPAARVKRDDRVWVYKRKNCRRCEKPIRWWTLGTRKIYACESCQRPTAQRGKDVEQASRAARTARSSKRI